MLSAVAACDLLRCFLPTACVQHPSVVTIRYITILLLHYIPAGAAASVKLLLYNRVLSSFLFLSLVLPPTDLHDNFIISPVVIPTSSMKNKPRQNSLIFCLEDFVK